MAYTNGFVRWLVPSARDLLAEKFLRNVNAYASPVTGFAIGVHCAAVPDIFECLDAHLNDLAAWFAVERCNETNAASRMLVRGVV